MSHTAAEIAMAETKKILTSSPPDALSPFRSTRSLMTEHSFVRLA